MKRIIYLSALFLCLAGCKKEEVTERVKFVKVFIANTSSFNNLAIETEANKYEFLSTISLPLQDNKFVFRDKATGKVVLDTTVRISGSDSFQLTGTDPLQRPVLVRSPLSGEMAAPAGYMKIKIANHAPFPLPFDKVDIVVTSFYPVDGVNIPIGTLKSVGTDYNKDLFLIKRQFTDGVLNQLQLYTISFVNSETGEPVKRGNGQVYTTTLDATITPATPDNLYMVELASGTSLSKLTGIPASNGKYYTILVKYPWSR